MATAGSALYLAVPFARSIDGRPDLAIYADDFFYYLVIAEHVLAGEGFTFDGVTPTNGFHPLWMALLLATGAIAPPRSATFFVILHSLLLGLTLATAAGCWRMLRSTFGYGGVPALAASALATVQALMLARSGMETALALPLIFLAVIAAGHLLARPNFARAVLASLLAALAVLARLDAAILFSLIGTAAGLAAWRRGQLAPLLSLRVLAGIALGALPLIADLVVNMAWFGALTPISGQAKQLAPWPVFNPTAFVWFAWSLYQIASLRPHNPVFVLTAAPAILTLLVLAVARRARVVPPTGREALAHALIAFPFVYFVTIGLLSDWAIWVWYMYAVVPASAVMAAGITHALLGRRAYADRGWHLALPVVAALAGGALIAHEAPHSSVTGRSLVEAGRALAAFAADHPGRYAMGDRAGVFAFLTDQPVVQLEGLVGDARLLAAIRERRSLLDELEARGVDYYVASRLVRYGDCWLAEEPHPMQAGSRSPRMVGRICTVPALAVAARDGVTSLVFDLRAMRTGAPR